MRFPHTPSPALAHLWEWIESLTNLEKRPPHRTHLRRAYRLARMQKLATLCGNPHHSYKIIHVAGSKGKSSVANTIAEILAAAGYRVGCYLSPHVSDWRERIQVKPHQPSDEQLLHIGASIRTRCEAHYNSPSVGDSPVWSHPTTFELLTVWALLCFQKLQCQWVVLECGLGGRHDATNIVLPEASVITVIEREHTEYLGTQLRQIAREKAGIIKPRVPLFVLNQSREPLSEIEQIARHKAAPISIIDCTIEKEPTTETGGSAARLTVNNLTSGVRRSYNYTKGSRRHRMEYQNAALAATTVSAICPPIKRDIVERALSQSWLPGRYEQLSYNPDIVCDGAHTPRSIRTITESFKAHFGTKGTLVFGCRTDKAIEEIAAIIAPAFTTIYLTPIPHPQSALPSELRAHFAAHNTAHGAVRVIDGWHRVIQSYLESVNTDTTPTTTLPPLLICGSFYLVGAARKMILEHQKRPLTQSGL